MSLTRVVVPLLFVATVFAGATGCRSSSSTPTITPSPVPTCTGNCTALPTATPSGPTPTPSPVPSAFQPLVNNDTWTYACSNGSTATKAISTGAVVNGVQTSADTLSFSNTVLIPTPITGMEAIDGIGNTLIYQWNVGNSTTAVSPPGVEYGIQRPAPVSMYQGPVTGTITMTDTGNIGSLTVPAGTFNNVELFKAVNSQPIYPPALTEVDSWMVLGTGPIQLGFPDANGGAVTCSATVITLH